MEPFLMTTTFALADSPLYQTPAAPSSAAERRIVSVLPLITKLANRWLRDQHPRQRAQYDLEDIIQELWAELLAVDPSYDPSKSAYTTWVMLIVPQRLARLGQRRPGNRQEPLAFDVIDGNAPTAAESFERAEDAQQARQAVQQGMERLDDAHYSVLAWTYGLLDRTPKPAGEQAAFLMKTVPQVLQLRTEAEDTLRRYLAS
jgi:RNA polymerase sigma factor (sigma-70 family)